MKRLLAFAAIYVVWGSTYLAIRYAVESVPPLLMAGARFLSAGALLYAWARSSGVRPPRGREWRLATVLGGLLFVGGGGALAWAEQRVASGLAALIYATIPLWVVLLEWLGARRSRVGRRLVAGLVTGFVGVALLVLPREGASGAVDLIGAAALLVGALSWAAGSLQSVRAELPASPVMVAAMEMVTGGALLLAIGLAAGESARLELGAVSVRSVAALGYLIAFGSLASFTAYVWLLGVTEPSRVATYAFVNPVVAVVLGWAVGGEPLNGRTLIAAAVIVAAVTVIVAERSGLGAQPPRSAQRSEDRP